MSATAARVALVGARERRRRAAEALRGQVERVAHACRDMGARFDAGGRLLTFGDGVAAADAAHVAVEFVHPVIVGTRALDAIALSNDIATLASVARRDGWDNGFAHQVSLLGRPGDIALGIAPAAAGTAIVRALEVAHGRGMLTIALTGACDDLATRPFVDHCLTVASDDPRVVKELHVTLYHVLWELVHVMLGASASRAGETCGAGVCVTCSDEARPARVVAVFDGGMATVEADGRVEDVSIALVDAGVGDVVLVHAGEAIGVPR